VRLLGARGSGLFCRHTPLQRVELIFDGLLGFQACEFVIQVFRQSQIVGFDAPLHIVDPASVLLDKTYVSDATDNSGFEGVPGAPSHSAQRAEAFLGAPMTFNAGLQVRF